MNYKISRIVEITLCEGCNLNCSYCYEINKRSNKINFQLAKEIIADEMGDAKSCGETAIMIYFHGGEICLCFELLRDICEWLWSQNWGIPYLCSATTNGILVHNEIQEWFKKNSKRFVLCLSLDGNRKMHNVNRGNSYDLIDLSYFLKTYPDQPVKMTISPNTIGTVSEGIIDVVKKGFKLSANLAYGCEWNEKMKYQYAQELYKLSQFFLANPAFDPPKNLLEKKLIGLGYSVYVKEPITPKKYCGSGSSMRCYDMSGRKFPCQMFMASVMNKDFAKKKIENKDLKYNDECSSCALVNICATCLGQCFSKFGDLLKTPDELCDFHKIEILNYSFFLYNMLQQKDKYNITRKMTDYEISLNILAISKIQDVIQHSKIIKYIECL